jgi:glutaconate CoA-transferase subunit B
MPPSAASPIPAAAACGTRARRGRPRVSLLGSRRRASSPTAGASVRLRRPGPIGVFFLSGAQIDGQGNINLVSIGDYAHPKARFPGSFGSSYMYYVVPKVVLFRLEHTRRTLVPKVDFISAPGTSPDNVHRPGGPIALITNRCLFAFDRERRRFRLASVHPGHTVAEVVENTGFEFDQPGHVPLTAAPSPKLRLLHGDRAAAGRSLSAICCKRVWPWDKAFEHPSSRASGESNRDEAGWRGGATSDSQAARGGPA